MADIDVLKAPPQDLAAEQAVLGAIFLDSERLIEVSEFIAADDFYKTSHQIIFRIMMRLQDERSPIDVLTVHTLLDNQGDLDRKSTRLNSSHQKISYAVFCLKK